ncbi:MAG: type I secretion system permease/ATPase [Alphaproteobacteria bacterium]
MAAQQNTGTPAGKSPLTDALTKVRGAIAVVAVFSFFLNALYLVTPIYMLQVYDRVLSSGVRETLIYLTVIACLALAVLGALEIVRAASLSRISSWLERQLSGTVLAGSVDLSLAGQNPGAQMLRDLGQVRSFLRDGVRPIFDVPWTPAFIAVIWYMHWWLGVLALASAVILFILAVANEMAIRKPHRAANAGLVNVYRSAETAMRNADVIRAMGMLPAMLGRWGRANDDVLRHQQQAADRVGAIVGISRFVRLFVQVGILGLGALLVLRGELTAGGMIAGSILLGRALAPIEQAIGAWRELAAARSSHQRLQKLFDALPPNPPTIQLPTPTGRLAVERLSFVPPGGREPVLKQVSVDAEPGTVLGVIGPSAAGKSTLCKLIVGIWPPSAGHVRLDGADVYGWDRVDFGRHVGYLPQDVELFTGSVRENIARMAPPGDDPKSLDEQVVAAAMLADVHDMILRLPDNYDTQIGENGANLSGGQRQRIGLARALFAGPKLLVLDEPNANLDQDGEAALLRAIAKVKQQGTTVVLVAHRPSLLQDADKILVLRDGAVEMTGTYDDVIKRFGARAPHLQQVR